MIVSNVPGPQVALELLGRPLTAAWPAVPLLDGHALTIGALSYAGRLNVSVYADAEVVPDARRSRPTSSPRCWRSPGSSGPPRRRGAPARGYGAIVCGLAARSFAAADQRAASL